MSQVKAVCIIDDDKIYRFTTEKYIEMLGLADKVITYADGEEALDYLKAKSSNSSELPDIIFLDVNMPIMDGWDFIEEYSKIASSFPKKVVLYMVSSSIDERDSNRAKEIAEITDFIVKPITEERLVQLISANFA